MARSLSQFHFSGGWLSNINDLDHYTHFLSLLQQVSNGGVETSSPHNSEGRPGIYKALSWNTTLPHNMQYDEPWTRGSWLNFSYNFSCISNFGNYSCLPQKYHPRHSYDGELAYEHRLHNLEAGTRMRYITEWKVSREVVNIFLGG